MGSVIWLLNLCASRKDTMKITHLDHLVLTVSNIDTTVEFYRRALNMEKQIFAGGRTALMLGQQKINLHQIDNTFIPGANAPTPGSADLCFVTETPLSEAMLHVQHCGVKILQGPVTRTGAAGPMMSFYFRDPDGNLIEVCCY